MRRAPPRGALHRPGKPSAASHTPAGGDALPPHGKHTWRRARRANSVAVRRKRHPCATPHNNLWRASPGAPTPRPACSTVPWEAQTSDSIGAFEWGPFQKFRDLF